jgi:hypothetical protein
MEKKNSRQLILDTLTEKSVVKQDVMEITHATFKEFKLAAKELTSDVKIKIAEIDPRLIIEFKDKGEYEFYIRIAADVLVFTMHTSIFDFDKSHNIWKSSYVKDKPQRTMCGVFHIYNFLADSFEYNRMDDLGYLIARVFINSEKHFFVEGKRQLAFLYNDFKNAVISRDQMIAVIESAILYSMDFDLLTPPYDNVKLITVSQIMEWSNNLSIRTGKRLGFKFQADVDDIF